MLKGAAGQRQTEANPKNAKAPTGKSIEWAATRKIYAVHSFECKKFTGAR
jgi:hypothetical protein